MNHTAFVVTRFENRNGSISWRVAGWLHGLRIRKNFPTREEAAAEKAVLELKALQASAGMRPALTALDDLQLREAEALFRRLAGRGRSLSFYLDFALANYREPEQQKTLVAAVTEYTAAKEHEFEQDHLSEPQFKRIKSELKRLQEHFSGKSVAELSTPILTAFLEIGRPGLKTHNNRRGILSTFCKFAFLRGWAAENPVLKVPHHRLRRRRGAAVTLTAIEAAQLMDYLEGFEGGRWVPYFSLCLFAGIRPGVPYGEIRKLMPAMVNLEEGLIHVPAEVSKVREPRRVTVQPNLARWLRAYPLDRFPIVVGNFRQRIRPIRKKFGLTHDVLRHTFISMFVAKYRSMGEAALQAGNSESIIRRHYLDLKSREEAERFFAIVPKHQMGEESSPVVGPQLETLAVAV